MAFNANTYRANKHARLAQQELAAARALKAERPEPDRTDLVLIRHRAIMAIWHARQARIYRELREIMR